MNGAVPCGVLGGRIWILPILYAKVPDSYQLKMNHATQTYSGRKHLPVMSIRMIRQGITSKNELMAQDRHLAGGYHLCNVPNYAMMIRMAKPIGLDVRTVGTPSNVCTTRCASP